MYKKKLLPSLGHCDIVKVWRNVSWSLFHRGISQFYSFFFTQYKNFALYIQTSFFNGLIAWETSIPFNWTAFVGYRFKVHSRVTRGLGLHFYIFYFILSLFSLFFFYSFGLFSSSLFILHGCCKFELEGEKESVRAGRKNTNIYVYILWRWILYVQSLDVHAVSCKISGTWNEPSVLNDRWWHSDVLVICT